MKFRIVSDSSCDMNVNLKEKIDIKRVPLKITIEDHEFVDNETLNIQELLKTMRDSKTVPKTASPSPADFIKEYDEENVFVVTLSSALSSTYNNAVLAKNMIIEKAENKFIHVFDSLSASVGQTLVCIKISELIKNNYESNEIVKRVNEYIKEMKTFFILESLDNLIKSGRISKLKGHIASALSIKPIMGGSEKGTIKLVDKVRGSKRAFKRLVDIIGEQGYKLEDKILGIAHCNCLDRAEKLKEKIKERYKFKDIIIVEMGGLSSVYANEGGIVIAF